MMTRTPLVNLHDVDDRPHQLPFAFSSMLASASREPRHFYATEKYFEPNVEVEQLDKGSKAAHQLLWRPDDRVIVLYETW